MARHAARVAALIAVSLFATAPSASALSFTFESTAPGAYAGALTATDNGVTLTVTPEGDPNGWIVVQNPNVPLLGSLSAIGSHTNPTTVNGFDPMRFTFSAPISNITFAFGDGGGDDDSAWLIQAYSASNVLLASLTGSYPANFSAGMTATLSTPTGAAYYILSTSPAFNPNSIYWEVPEAVAAAVPEPMTLGLVGSCLWAGIAARRRRA